MVASQISGCQSQSREADSLDGTDFPFLTVSDYSYPGFRQQAGSNTPIYAFKMATERPDTPLLVVFVAALYRCSAARTHHWAGGDYSLGCKRHCSRCLQVGEHDCRNSMTLTFQTSFHSCLAGHSQL